MDLELPAGKWTLMHRESIVEDFRSKINNLRRYMRVTHRSRAQDTVCHLVNVRNKLTQGNTTHARISEECCLVKSVDWIKLRE